MIIRWVAKLCLLTMLLQAPAAIAFTFSEHIVNDSPHPGLQVGLWAPEMGERLPLVVISPGTGEDLSVHRGLAEYLAEAGFVVVAITHTGDNFDDTRFAFTIQNFVNRTRHIQKTIDFALRDSSVGRRIDRDEIALFGHSAGAFSGLLSVGAEPDFSRGANFCADNPNNWECVRIASAMRSAPPLTEAPIFTVDERIKALVIAAPAGTYSFGPLAFDNIIVPIQLWIGMADTVAPAEQIESTLSVHLDDATETQRVAGAGHFDFLDPCTDQLLERAPVLCEATPEFSRSDFSVIFRAGVLKFLQQRLNG